jgi:hypothetical protein
MADWVGWHTAYGSDTPLARRLVAVQEQVAPCPLLAAGGTVIWTRHTGAPDRIPRLRAWCAAAGVTETAFVTGDHWSVGAGVRHAAPEELPVDERLFTFVG